MHAGNGCHVQACSYGYSAFHNAPEHYPLRGVIVVRDGCGTKVVPTLMVGLVDCAKVVVMMMKA
eukprot:1194928-Prorocentrum_minimum.AAC.8